MLVTLIRNPSKARAAEPEEQPLRGKLIFADGTLQSFDLETKKVETLLTEGMVWPGISVIGPARYLISVGGEIIEFDLAVGSRRILGRGYNAQYIAETRQILYLRALGGPRPALFVGALERLEESSRRIGEEEYSLRFSAQILPGPVAMFPSTRPEAGPWRYDFRTESLERVGALRGFIPVAWRSATHQLLTVDSDRPEYRLSDPRGGASERVEGLERGVPVLYVPEYDACLVNMRVSGVISVERSDLFWFSFRRRKLMRLKERMALYPGKVIFASAGS